MTEVDVSADSLVGLMDFTLLDLNATTQELQSFCDKANIAKPAAICVFSEQVSVVKGFLEEGILIAAVCGSFPIGSVNREGQDEVVRSIECAKKAGADEIDAVLEPRDCADFPGPVETEWLTAVRSTCGSLTLKVILETPLLSEAAVSRVSQFTLAGGADFLKSCTGKRGECTHTAARVMARELRMFEECTGEKRGIKISGGVQTKQQAAELLGEIVSTFPAVLCSKAGGVSRQDCTRIRVGASSLMKNLAPHLYSSQPPFDRSFLVASTSGH